jgi:hypothetical protein
MTTLAIFLSIIIVAGMYRRHREHEPRLLAGEGKRGDE